MTAATATIGSPREVPAVVLSAPSPSDMPRKRHKPEEITTNLEQVDVPVTQHQSIDDATRPIERSKSRLRQQRAASKTDDVKNPQALTHEVPRRWNGEVSAVQDNNRQMEFKAQSSALEE